MENAAVRQLLERYIEEKRIAGAYVIVRRDGEPVCDAGYGYADLERQIPVGPDTIFRLASMTKPVIAVCVMLLEQDGLLSIDDPLERFLPAYGKLRAADRLVGFEDFYEADPNDPSRPRMRAELLEDIHPVPLKRPVSLRDMLTHSSGLGQGPVSMGQIDTLFQPGQTLEERVEMIPSVLLDFQPGEATGYSACVAFDVLGRVVELVSGRDLQSFIRERILEPLDIHDLSFVLTGEQKDRMARLYESQPGQMADVTESEPFWKLVDPLPNGYFSGSAGMLGSAAAYDRFVSMLASGGMGPKGRILTEETVRRMSRDAACRRMEMCPGTVWGLGMAVVEEPDRSGRKVSPGTYGWSGAYGTHFIIDPQKHITAVLAVNCSNIGGADSVLSRELEEVVSAQW